MQVICNDKGAEEVLARMSIYPDAKGICKLAIGNVETLAKRFLDSNPNLFEFWFKQYIMDFIGSEHTIKEYTELLNPGSTSASASPRHMQTVVCRLFAPCWKRAIAAGWRCRRSLTNMLIWVI